VSRKLVMGRIEGDGRLASVQLEEYGSTVNDTGDLGVILPPV
jgi:hypothetical protein